MYWDRRDFAHPACRERESEDRDGDRRCPACKRQACVQRSDNGSDSFQIFVTDQDPLQRLHSPALEKTIDDRSALRDTAPDSCRKLFNRITDEKCAAKPARALTSQREVCRSIRAAQFSSDRPVAVGR